MKLFALDNTKTKTLGLHAGSTSKQLLRLGALAMLAAVALIPHPVRAAEHELAGIRIFASSKEVLARYGNPNEILTGANALNGVPLPGSGATTLGPNGGSPYGGSPYGGSPYGGAMGGAMGSPRSGPYGMPRGAAMSPYGGGYPAAAMAQMNRGGPGGGYAPAGAIPNMGGMGGEGGIVAGPNSGQTDSGAGDEVLYVYQRSRNLTIDFLLSADGRVIQIQTFGNKPGLKTAKAATFGTDYKTIVSKYGYPESQDNSNGVLTMKYLQNQHVIFQLRGNRVVGITVAAVE